MDGKPSSYSVESLISDQFRLGRLREFPALAVRDVKMAVSSGSPLPWELGALDEVMPVLERILDA